MILVKRFKIWDIFMFSIFQKLTVSIRDQICEHSERNPDSILGFL